MIRKCRECGKDFTTENEYKYFCSEKCRQLALDKIDKNIKECLSCQ